MELSKLRPAAGSKSKRKRVGRGEGSGYGKTSGRGEKGQTARSGGSIARHFEGGQTPLYRRVPKIGFRSRKRVRGDNVFTIINLSDLECFEAGTKVDPEALRQVGRRIETKSGIKLLGKGTLTKKLSISVHAISKAAREKIEALGGSVEIISE